MHKSSSKVKLIENRITFNCLIFQKFQQPEVIADIVSQPGRAVDELSADLPLAAGRRLERRAAEIRQKFFPILMEFADVHGAINHSNPLTERDIDLTGKTPCLFSFFLRLTWLQN